MTISPPNLGTISHTESKFRFLRSVFTEISQLGPSLGLVVSGARVRGFFRSQLQTASGFRKYRGFCRQVRGGISIFHREESEPEGYLGHDFANGGFFASSIARTLSSLFGHSSGTVNSEATKLEGDLADIRLHRVCEFGKNRSSRSREKGSQRN